MSREFRQAVETVVDRKQIVQILGYGTTLALRVPVSLPDSAELSEDQPGPDAVQGKATRLDRQSDPSAKGLEILVHEKDAASEIGELLKYQLDAAGIPTTLVRLSFSSVIDRLIKGEFQAVVMGFEYPFSEPGLILSQFFSSHSIPMPNFFRYKNDKVEGYMSKLPSTGDARVAQQYLSAIEKEMLNDPPAAFLFENRNPVLFGKRLSGINLDSHSMPKLENVVEN